MRKISKIAKKKKGISLLVSYVLLITIAITLSILVYNWLRFYVQPNEAKTCPEGIAVQIQDYECVNARAGGEGYLNLTLKNKGRFNVDGFMLKVHDKENRKIGLYSFTDTGVPLNTSEVYEGQYSFSELEGNTSIVYSLTLIEVQPFIYENGEKIVCESVSSQNVEC